MYKDNPIVVSENDKDNPIVVSENDKDNPIVVSENDVAIADDPVGPYMEVSGMVNDYAGDIEILDDELYTWKGRKDKKAKILSSALKYKRDEIFQKYEIKLKELEPLERRFNLLRNHGWDNDYGIGVTKKDGDRKRKVAVNNFLIAEAKEKAKQQKEDNSNGGKRKNRTRRSKKHHKKHHKKTHRKY